MPTEAEIAAAYAAEEESLSPQALKHLQIGKEKKDAGDAAFKAGKLSEALMAYHQALMYIRGLNKSNPMTPDKDPAEKPKSQIDDILEKVYSNMSACYLRQGKWERTVESADKALGINKDNFKAMYRKGKALGEQGYYERAVKVLEELRTKNPSDAAAVNSELERLRVIEKGREKVANQKFKGFLAKNKNVLATPTKASEEETSARIEEIVEATSSARIEEVA